LSAEWDSRKTAASRRKIVGSEFEAGRWRTACDVPDLSLGAEFAVRVGECPGGKKSR